MNKERIRSVIANIREMKNKNPIPKTLPTEELSDGEVVSISLDAEEE